MSGAGADPDDVTTIISGLFDANSWRTMTKTTQKPDEPITAEQLLAMSADEVHE